MFVRPEVVSPVSGIVCPVSGIVLRLLGSFSATWVLWAPPVGCLCLWWSFGVLRAALFPLNGRLPSDTRPSRRISLLRKHLDFGREAIVWKEAFGQSHPLEGCPSPGDV